MGGGSIGLAVFHELLIYPDFVSCSRESFHLLSFEIPGFITTSTSSIEENSYTVQSYRTLLELSYRTSLLTHRHRLGCAQKLKEFINVSGDLPSSPSST